MAADHETDSGGTGFEESDLISLGQKLAALDLTEPERAALGALISDDDVGGFGRFGRFDIIGGIRVGLRKGSGRFGVRDPHVRHPGVRANPIIGGGLPKPGRF